MAVVKRSSGDDEIVVQLPKRFVIKKIDPLVRVHYVHRCRHLDVYSEVARYPHPLFDNAWFRVERLGFRD
jgi:hypothetical protein